jgi:hypothetical protein
MMSHKQQPIQDKTRQNLFLEILRGYVLTVLIASAMTPAVMSFFLLSEKQHTLPAASQNRIFFAELFSVYAVCKIGFFGLSRIDFFRKAITACKHFIYDYVCCFYAVMIPWMVMVFLGVLASYGSPRVNLLPHVMGMTYSTFMVLLILLAGRCFGQKIFSMPEQNHSVPSDVRTLIYGRVMKTRNELGTFVAVLSSLALWCFLFTL